MSLLFLFLLTAIISFLGSLQLGIVNLTVIRTAITHHFKAAVFVAVGGCLPEFFYGWLAISGIEIPFIQTHIKTLSILLIFLFLAIGIYYILKKNNSENIEIKKADYFSDQFFLKGLALSFINFQLLPFWLVMSIQLQQFKIIQSFSFAEKIAFSSGATVGAFLLLYLAAYLSYRNKNFFTDRLFKKYNLNKFFGFLFIGLAVLQIFKLLFS